MVNISKWPKVWFNLFMKPGKTASMLKSERPQLVDGVTSFALTNVLVGFVMFLFSSIFSILALAIGGDLGGMLISLLLSFAVLVIAYPAGMVILLLLMTAAFKLASKAFKGNASYGEEVGILGVLGSAGLLLTIFLYIVVFVFMFAGGFLGAIMGMVYGSTALIYLLMGLAYLIVMPPCYLLIAETFDLVSAIEKVSIYRAGAIIGLFVGIMFFAMMVGFSVLVALLGGAVQMFAGGMSPGL